MENKWGETKPKIEEKGNGNNNVPPALASENDGNHIYVYADISKPSMLLFNKQLRVMANQYFAESVLDGVEYIRPINIHINSYGGTIADGVAAMDEILQWQKRGVTINTIIEGCVCSAATFISVVGSERYMMPHATMMIHQLSSGCWGKFEDFKDEMDNLKLYMKQIKSIYKDFTKVSMKQLDAILKHDLLWNAEECLKKGLIDEIC